MMNSQQNWHVLVERLSQCDFDGPDHLGLLNRRAVALYLIDLRHLAFSEAQADEVLSVEERERAVRFHFERDRLRYAAVRILLRKLFARHLGIRPQQIEFQYSDKGKPSLASQFSHCGIAFNASHSGDFALLGFTSNQNIGVDIEQIRDDFDSQAIARRFFSEREQRELARLPLDQRHHAFFSCWTRKEAFIKALGEGLSHPLNEFDVSLDAAPEVLLATRPDPAEASRWRLQAIDAETGYAAAFAVSTT